MSRPPGTIHGTTPMPEGNTTGHSVAISDVGLVPVCEPFRGETDGAALSFRGLPCPNLSASYENAHGRFEFVPIQSMEKNVEILLRLCSIFAGTAV